MFWINAPYSNDRDRPDFTFGLILGGVIFMLMLHAVGCSGTGIALKEKFGYAKREQLVDRVQEARDEQVEAKEQFNSALEEFLSVTNVEVGELEAKYDEFNRQYERSVDKAEDVRDRIRSVEKVAELLFEEWESELEEYTSETLRESSARQLQATRSHYKQLLRAMKRAEASMEPVLATFKDHVLFLKHNLNARAIASLQDNVSVLETDVAELVREMEASIAEANAFIDQMRNEGDGA